MKKDIWKNRIGRLKRCIAGVGIVALSVLSMPSMVVSAYQDGDNTYEWRTGEDGKSYWYENGVRQGMYGDSLNVYRDNIERGREIYDRESDAWYWLDARYQGAKAINKEVFIPYVYRDEEDHASDQAWLGSVSALSNRTAEIVQEIGGEVVDLSAQVQTAIRSHGAGGPSQDGKWVRYDSQGRMVKGWYKVQGADEIYYPDQVGNVYYYDRQTGLMAKGTVTIDGVEYTFDTHTGRLTSGNEPDILSQGNPSGEDSTVLTEKEFDYSKYAYLVSGYEFDADEFSQNTDAVITVDGKTRLDNGSYHVYSGAKSLSSDVKVGDVIRFGVYEQDNDTSNGMEPIEWEVLDIDSDKALLVSRYVLEVLPYNAGSVAVTWEESSLREWLNGTFYNTAFNETEKTGIIESTVENPDNVVFHVDGGKVTTDRLFCLSAYELLTYYGFSYYDPVNAFDGCSEQLIIDATPYVKENTGKDVYSRTITEKDYTDDNDLYWQGYRGKNLNDLGFTRDAIGKNGLSFWTRTPGAYSSDATVSNYLHTYSSLTANAKAGIRPALYVKR